VKEDAVAIADRLREAVIAAGRVLP
jgi:hypothetical protein